MIKVQTLLCGLLAAGLILILPAQAQEADPIGDRVDAVFAEWDRDDSPGCAVGVYDDGEIAYEAGYGIANLDHGIPITPETVFYVGSVSKQLATASIALLALRGDLSLDDDIREHLPEMPVYDEPITIRHLIHHTSGIRDIYALMRLRGDRYEDVMTDEEALELIASQQSLNFAPGEEYLYSNSGYFLLGQIVERASGQSLREFADEHLFGPLGMDDTHFHDDRTHIVPRRAMSYQSAGDGYRLSYLANFERVGPGGLYSTVRDFLQWDRQLTEDRLGTPGFNELMHTRGTLSNGDTLDYAFALSHGEYKGLKTVGHGGSYMGFRAHYVRFPEEALSVAVFCNLGSIDPGELAHEVADIFLEDVVEEHLSEYAGTYRNADLGVRYALELREGDLHLVRERSPNGALQPAGEDTFRISSWTLAFSRDETGQIDGFTIDAGRARGVAFEKDDGPQTAGGS